MIQRYRGKISGPLLDRIDLHVDVPAVPVRALSADAQAEPSAAIRARVEAARARQAARYGRDGGLTNAQLRGRAIRRHCAVDGEARRLLETAVERLGLSARAYTRILKVARTIADLAGRDTLAPSDIAEAIQYRTLDRRLVT